MQWKLRQRTRGERGREGGQRSGGEEDMLASPIEAMRKEEEEEVEEVMRVWEVEGCCCLC
jgi:hypothetical protein